MDKISYNLTFSYIIYKINNNNYPIQNVNVLSLINKNSYKDEINLENKILNELAIIIINESIKNDDEKIKLINEVNLLKINGNNDNYINKLFESNNEDKIIQIINNKKFYYCKSNKTIYSLENGGPGVSDLVKFYNYFISNNISNNTILDNIFTIKRSGDYLQVEYCKRNNYIFVSTDQMSASFCYLDNCEFIGPFGNCGLFIKKYENKNKYCYDSKEYILHDYKCNLNDIEMK